MIFLEKRLCEKAKSDECFPYGIMHSFRNDTVYGQSFCCPLRLFTQEFLYDQYVFFSITCGRADGNKSLLFDELV